jgi:hypothetical protein
VEIGSLDPSAPYFKPLDSEELLHSRLMIGSFGGSDPYAHLMLIGGIR